MGRKATLFRVVRELDLDLRPDAGRRIHIKEVPLLEKALRPFRKAAQRQYLDRPFQFIAVKQTGPLTVAALDEALEEARGLDGWLRDGVMEVLVRRSIEAGVLDWIACKFLGCFPPMDLYWTYRIRAVSKQVYKSALDAFVTTRPWRAHIIYDPRGYLLRGIGDVLRSLVIPGDRIPKRITESVLVKPCGDGLELLSPQELGGSDQAGLQSGRSVRSGRHQSFGKGMGASARMKNKQRRDCELKRIVQDFAKEGAVPSLCDGPTNLPRYLEGFPSRLVGDLILLNDGYSFGDLARYRQLPDNNYSTIWRRQWAKELRKLATIYDHLPVEFRPLWRKLFPHLMPPEVHFKTRSRL